MFFISAQFTEAHHDPITGGPALAEVWSSLATAGAHTCLEVVGHFGQSTRCVNRQQDSTMFMSRSRLQENNTVESTRQKKMQRATSNSHGTATPWGGGVTAANGLGDDLAKFQAGRDHKDIATSLGWLLKHVPHQCTRLGKLCT